MSTKHTWYNCFKLIGYPDWWHELQAWKKRDTTNIGWNISQATLVVVEPHLSLIPPNCSSKERDFELGNIGFTLVTLSLDSDHGAWLLDYRAINHMTFDVNDFLQHSIPRWTSVANAKLFSLFDLKSWLYSSLSPSLLLLSYLIHYLCLHFHINYFMLVKSLRNYTVLCSFILFLFPL